MVQVASGSIQFVLLWGLLQCQYSLASRDGTKAKLSRTETMPQSDIENFSSVIPLGRMCTPEDVAGAVAYLVGPDAKFITGVNLQVGLAS